MTYEIGERVAAIARARREDAAAAARQRAAEAREDAAIRDLIARDRRAGCLALIDTLVKRHRITVRWIPRTEGARAASRSRIVWTWTLDNDEAIATALHEIAHIVHPCPMSAPHQRSGSSGCIACEVAATGQVQRWLPLTKEQHTYLGRCLRTYRETPAPAAAVQRLDHLAGSRSHAEDKQQRLRWALLQERQRLAMTGGTHR